MSEKVLRISSFSRSLSLSLVRFTRGRKKDRQRSDVRIPRVKDGEEDEREEIARGRWRKCGCRGQAETFHEHGKQNERERARKLAKKRGDREAIENVQTATDKR